MIRKIMVLSVLFFLSACGDDINTGPDTIRWDREVCIRCSMALSDRQYAAQIRDTRQGKNKVYKFDDIGCAVIWLDKQNLPIKSTEVWVNEHNTEQWIDARKAWFVKAKNTPMGYGLGAQREKIKGALSFTDAKKHIYAVEQRSNSPHSGHVQTEKPNDGPKQ